MGDHGQGQEKNRYAVEELKRLRKHQRRFQIEMLIAVALIFLLLGFVAGASWQWLKFRETHQESVAQPSPEPAAPPGRNLQ